MGHSRGQERDKDKGDNEMQLVRGGDKKRNQEGEKERERKREAVHEVS